MSTMQITDQAAEQPARQIPGRFEKGVSGNPRGSLSKAEREALLRAKLQALAEPFGGLSALDAINRERLDQAARLLLDTRRRSAVDTVRYAHIVERLLAAVEAGASRRGTRSIGG
jgi:BMFP domain-containing protein YqiC